MAEKVTRKFKIIKWIFGIFLGVTILLVSISWYISASLKPLIKSELKALVLKSTQGLYQLQFSDLHTNLITGSATINDINIVPDTNVYKRMVAAKKAPNNLYYIKLKKLSIKNFKPLTVYFDKKVDVKLLLFDKPEIQMVNRHFDFNDDRPPRPRQSPYDYIKDLFKSIRVQTVDFRNAKFKYVNNNGLKPEIDSVNHISIKLTDWLIDSLSAEDPKRFYLLKDVAVNLNNYSFATPDSMYYLNVNELDFKASSGKVNIKKFAMVPRHSEVNFAKANGYARDRFSIQLNNINLFGINLQAYLQKRELIANQMQVANGSVDVFNNNSYPKLVKDRTGAFPHQLLQKLNAQLTIKAIKLSNIDVSYAEFDKTSKQKGKITFEKTSGVIVHGAFLAHLSYAYQLSRHLKVPLYLVPHGTTDPYVFSYGKLKKRIWLEMIGKPATHQAKKILFSTSLERDKSILPFAKNKGNICPFSVETPEDIDRVLCQRWLRQKLGLSDEEKILLYFG